MLCLKLMEQLLVECVTGCYVVLIVAWKHFGCQGSGWTTFGFYLIICIAAQWMRRLEIERERGKDREWASASDLQQSCAVASCSFSLQRSVACLERLFPRSLQDVRGIKWTCLWSSWHAKHLLHDFLTEHNVTVRKGRKTQCWDFNFKPTKD